MFLTIKVEIREKIGNSPTGEGSYVVGCADVDKLRGSDYSTQLAYMIKEAVDQHKHLVEMRGHDKEAIYG